ncbi:DNA internalization-related competence protein ComEC/Rec2 [Alishewanella longhuensis]|uniref:DNA internalization-related competence protein ComEC/Rec2 n=1 Tax=Alishewanella longhuensis TaxID=1091037 RepID=A0ABQ3L2F9_9ALTE|nr:ComEC/Rec2 family competence protein [Alishewanella longhuensis]GHG66961.1 DNA internalization-related competence protein ComEC/Rec2 [Alishewanella longhuensis]
MSLFLPALPVFFKIIFLSAFLLSLLCRQSLLAGVFALLCCWHWQLQAYLIAQSSVLGLNPNPSLLASPNTLPDAMQVRIANWRALEAGDIEVTAIIQQGVAKGYQLKLRWRNAPEIAVGQQWRLYIQLRPIRSHSNPGGRQQDIQALLQSIIAEGYVRPQQPAILLKAAPSTRHQLIARLTLWTAELQTAPLLLALTVGERQFSSDLWRGVQYSGLGHILTISGLHIGLVFGWGYFLAGLGLKSRFFKSPQNLTGSAAQLLIALSAAICYAWLAGFAIPTLRAAAALLLVVASRLLLKPLSGRYAWQLLVASLLLLNPFWMLSFSFWLSVLAVAVIFFLVWWLPAVAKEGSAKLVYFVVFHCILTMVMSLIGLAFFGGISALAVLSNLLFVSWCSLLAIPLLLFTLCWSLLALPYAQLLWQLTDWAFLPLWYWLEWCAEQAVWWSVPSLGSAAALLLAGALLIFLVLRLPWSPKILLLATIVLALMAPRPTSPQLILLDTGQSTVLLARHNQLNWLYLDAATSQMEGVIQHRVLPQLRYQRWRHLDLVLLPHLEREMQPALALLQQHYPEVRFYSATPILSGSYPCHKLVTDYANAGLQHWALTVADPCVVSAEFAGWRLLLPGRLTIWQEQRLIQRYPSLQSDLYLLADYGRPSANSLAWLQQLSPGLLLLSASEQGAYRYPLAAVQQRITLLGIPLYHSGKNGALTLHFSEDKLQIIAQRQQWRLRWLEKPAE